MRKIEAIPFKSFKEKLNIIKGLEGKGRIEILGDRLIYFEKIDKERAKKTN